MTSSAATDGQTELLEALVADEELVSMLEGLLIGDALLPLQKELLVTRTHLAVEITLSL